MKDVELPAELIEEVLSHLPVSSVRICCRVNKAWHHALTPRLYVKPRIADTETYLLLVETILSNPLLGQHTRHLDLRRVNGTQYTTRLPDLLGHTPLLRSFRAAQAAMTPALVTALSTLHHLTLLDLECINDRFEISRVIHAVAESPCRTLLYPRCAVATLYPIKKYPARLERFALRGGLRDDFIALMTRPEHPELRITSVLVSHAPSLTARPVLQLLRKWSACLTHLTVSWPLPRFQHNDLDTVLHYAPGIKYLSIAIDYISARFFETPSDVLQVLEFDYSGVGKRGLLKGDDLVDALENDEMFPALTRLGMTVKAREQLFVEKETLDDLTWAAETRGIVVYHVEHDRDGEESESDAA